MATWRIHRFRTDLDLYDTLNGAITGKKDIQNGLYMDGLTLVIDAGAGDVTVTFAPALGRLWTPEEIVDQILAAGVSLANAAELNRTAIAVRSGNPTYLRIGKDDGTIVTVKSGGTANALFGWSVTDDTVGEPFTDDQVMSRVGMGDQSWYAVTYK
jgi:hypothetical protein